MNFQRCYNKTLSLLKLTKKENNNAKHDLQYFIFLKQTPYPQNTHNSKYHYVGISLIRKHG